MHSHPDIACYRPNVSHSLTRSTSLCSPLSTYLGESCYKSVDFHYSQTMFASSGDTVDIWDVNRSEPIHSFEWGADTIHAIKFNKVEQNVVASCASDRNIVL